MTISRLLLGALLFVAAPAIAQTPAAPAPSARAAPPRTILFVGNSFTQGAHSAVRRYRADTVIDLNGDGHGGVPALFKAFAEQAGLSYTVSLETQGGKSLGFHHEERRQLFDRAWDVVVLQEFSTLDRRAPGDRTAYTRDATLLARLFAARNRQVRVELMATWSRADLVHRPGSRWSGTPIGAMADDLAAAAAAVRAQAREIDGVIPVGQAWSRAFAQGVADPDPYDGIAPGQVNLWAYDHYHGSTHGYYLEALVVFGHVTGVDPRSLGAGERAAADLGIEGATAVALQRIAAEQLSTTQAGEPLRMSH